MEKVLKFLKQEGPLVSSLIIFLIASQVYPFFLTYDNMYNLMRDLSILGIISVGVCTVIISGGINLAVGSISAVSAMTLAVLSTKTTALNAVLISLLAALVIGVIIGYIVSYLEIPPFIVTLAGLMFGRALTYIISNENSVRIHRSVLNEIKFLARGDILGIPTSFIIFIAIAVTLEIMLHYTNLGRTILAIGSNENGSKIMGLKVNSTKLFVYTLSSFLAGVAGILLAIRLGSAQPTAGTGYEFRALLSVVIGGTLITGGVGSVRGVSTGALILCLIDIIFNMQGNIDSFYRNLILGIVLLSIVIIQNRVSKTKKLGVA